MNRFLLGLILVVVSFGFLGYFNENHLAAQSTGPNAGNNRYNSTYTVVPNTLTSLTIYTTNVRNIHCVNTSGADTTFLLEDTAGHIYFPTVTVAATSPVFVAYYGETGLTMLGIKWQAGNASALACEVTGVQ